MKFNKTVLDNGLRIITIPQPAAVAMTALVLVETGSKYEKREESGIAHFLEHMCFKGTTKRPVPNQVAHELEGLGAETNAFTSHEYTGYYAKVAYDKGEQALEIVADIYLNPTFPREEIEKEKGVIIEEMKMYEDLPMRKAGEYFMQLLYGDIPAGRQILGDEKVIMAANQNSFKAFHQRFYLASETTLILAGKMDEGKMIELASQMFSKMPVGKKTDKEPVKESQNEMQIMLKHKESDQAHLVMGYRAFDMFDERRYTLMALAHVLGGGMSSRLFNLLREQMGAAYYVRCDADLYTDHGYVAASAGIQLKKIEEAIPAIKKEFLRLKDEPVSEKELEKVKNHLEGTTLLGLEGSDAIAYFYGIQELLKDAVITTEELIQRIKDVKSEGIRELANELFSDDKLNLTMIGPFKDEKKFRTLLA